MGILLDTNVLVRMSDPAQIDYQMAVDAVDNLHDAKRELFIVPQIIYEFWSVATRPVDKNGLGFSADDAEKSIAKFVKLFRLLKDERAIYENWLDLVTQHAVTGMKSFDARLAAAMKRHGIDHILTFNAADFRRYPHVQILDPKTIAENGEGS